MYQVPAEVWNAIADSQPLKTPWARKLFKLNQPAMLAELDAQGVDPSVVVAYQTMAPLLAENRAITAYIKQTGDSSLMSALPEILSVDEALLYAVPEWSLNREQLEALRVLLGNLL